MHKRHLEASYLGLYVEKCCPTRYDQAESYKRETLVCQVDSACHSPLTHWKNGELALISAVRLDAIFKSGGKFPLDHCMEPNHVSGSSRVLLDDAKASLDYSLITSFVTGHVVLLLNDFQRNMPLSNFSLWLI